MNGVTEKTTNRRKDGNLSIVDLVKRRASWKRHEFVSEERPHELELIPDS